MKRLNERDSSTLCDCHGGNTKLLQESEIEATFFMWTRATPLDWVIWRMMCNVSPFWSICICLDFSKMRDKGWWTRTFTRDRLARWQVHDEVGHRKYDKVLLLMGGKRANDLNNDWVGLMYTLCTFSAAGASRTVRGGSARETKHLIGDHVLNAVQTTT